MAVKSLNLSKNKITDEAVGHIVKALCESQIESVSFADNKLSEKCIEVVVGTLKTNKTLKKIDMTGNGI